MGSDCPFFVEGKSQLAKGRGEILNPIDIDLSGKYLKLINPEIHIGTAEAYGNVDLKEGNSIREVLKKPIGEWQNSLNNSFEKYAFSEHPEIKAIRDEMLSEGAVYAAMSGSGSTVFGIFEEKPGLSDEGELEWFFEL